MPLRNRVPHGATTKDRRSREASLEFLACDRNPYNKFRIDRRVELGGIMSLEQGAPGERS